MNTDTRQIQYCQEITALTNNIVQYYRERSEWYLSLNKKRRPFQAATLIC